jgi:PAS domain S-box-containing protein
MSDRHEGSGPELSPRERQLLKFAAEGLTDSAIARRIGISEATVGTYWGRVRIKLGPYNRTELVAIMLRSEHETTLQDLRKENQELTRALSEPGTLDERFYRDLLANAPDAILLVTETGRIQYANEAAGDLFGYSSEELEQLDVGHLIPEVYRNRHAEHRADYVRDPKRRQMGEHLQTPALHRTGAIFRIRAALSAISRAEGMVVMCVVRAVEESES